MISVKKMIMINIVVLIVLIGGGITGDYFYEESLYYIKTDNAKIDGDQQVIYAPASGTLAEWNGKDGKAFALGQELGKVQISAPTADNSVNTALVSVTTPRNTTIVLNKAEKGDFVSAGTPLAYAYDYNQLYVTANIKETNIQDVKIGKKVDIYVDAYPNETFTGRVKEVLKATASTFSLLPSSNDNANYTKVTQVIPVKISIDKTGFQFSPGMNVTVRIHK